MENKLKIYIASAGSGKTHTLTKEYLRLALRMPSYFRTIQAVTFTNKATNEMKERILKELHILSVMPRESPFFHDLIDITNGNDIDLRERAGNSLRSILNNYGYFRIKTIDSFFQEIIRAFFRELDIPSTFELRFDNNKVLVEAITRLIFDQASKLSKNSNIGLKKFADNLVKDGKGHDLVRGLTRLGGQLFREEVKESVANRLPTPKEIEDYKYSLKCLRDDIISKTTQNFTNFLLNLEKYGIRAEYLSYKESGVFSPYYKYKKIGSVDFIFQDGLPARLVKYLNSCDSNIFDGIIKKSDYSTEMAKALEAFLLSDAINLLKELNNIVTLYQAKYCSISAVLDYIEQFGLLADIKKSIDEVAKETNSMLISNNTDLIKRILDNSNEDAPFIYEKIGTIIQHHMIDEFQDTSSMQYHNFKPLISESISNNKENLVVGDAKQSIYRFRNSNSKILTTQIIKDFDGYTDVITMKENWRSTANIISFNNGLYSELTKLVKLELTSNIKGALMSNEYTRKLLEDSTNSIDDIYSDFAQELPEQKKNNDNGSVVIHKLDLSSSDKIDYILHDLILTIKDLQEKGVRPCDIAILTRKNKEAGVIAKYILEAKNKDEYKNIQLDVVSEEALSISASPIVNLIITSLRYIVRPYFRQNKEILIDSYRILASNIGISHEKLLNDDVIVEKIRDAGKKFLYDCIQDILNVFKDLVSDKDTAYVLKLLEMAFNIKHYLIYDIESFLENWDNGGMDEKVILPENENAVTIMTIHKSKGLGFKVVLAPILDYKLIEENILNPTILWVKDDNNAIGDFNYYIPISYKKALSKTIFAKEYFEETQKKIIDSLNLIYVATTRAKQELHIWLPVNTKKDSNNTVDKLLYNAIFEDNNYKPKELFSNVISVSEPYIDNESNSLSVVNTVLNKKDTNSNIISIQRITTSQIERRLSILNEGFDYFNENNPRKHGRVLHNILSRIETQKDIDKEILDAVNKGLITSDDAYLIQESINSLLKGDSVYHWFDGTAEVKNEIPIIGGDLSGSIRADRILIYPDNSVVVIDYKFGEMYDKYKYQVKKYMTYLEKMGYDKVKGFLWYVIQNEVVQVH